MQIQLAPVDLDKSVDAISWPGEFAYKHAIQLALVELGRCVTHQLAEGICMQARSFSWLRVIWTRA